MEGVSGHQVCGRARGLVLQGSEGNGRAEVCCGSKVVVVVVVVEKFDGGF